MSESDRKNIELATDTRELHVGSCFITLGEGVRIVLERPLVKRSHGGGLEVDENYAIEITSRVWKAGFHEMEP